MTPSIHKETLSKFQGMFTSYGYAFSRILVDIRSRDNMWYLWRIACVDYFRGDGSFREDMAFNEGWSNKFLDIREGRLNSIVEVEVSS